MTEYVFMGGDRDGERHNVSESLPVVRMPKRTPAAFMDDAKIAISLEHESYRRAELGCLTERWFVYVLTSLPDREIIARLLDGCRKP